jgi:hypothetical protein
LRAGAGAVDLVGKEDIGKDRPGVEGKLAGLLAVDGGAGHVRRQQVGGELDAREYCGNGLRQRTRQHRLADARNVFQQNMPVGKQRGKHLADYLFLAENDARDVVGDELDLARRAQHLLRLKRGAFQDGLRFHFDFSHSQPHVL